MTLMTWMDSRFDHEVVCGTTITILATTLAITDLAGGRFGDARPGSQLPQRALFWWESEGRSGPK